MNPIDSNTILKGKIVHLLPLQEEHFELLYALSKEQRIWEFYAKDMTTKDKVFEQLHNAIEEREKATQFPFVILHIKSQSLIGSTRLMDIVPLHEKLEIGWTWLQPDYWGTAVNYDCKLLLLSFCFEKLKARRVQFQTDENNIRSRTAITKIGARYEGTLRHDTVRDDNSSRNSAYFSIINTEWEAVKVDLEKLLLINILSNK